MDKSETLTWAEYYLEKGFSIIPVNVQTKEPILKSWKEYQEHRPNQEELEKWFANGAAGIAIVTGGLSGVVVIDVDSKEAQEKIKPYLPKDKKCPIVKTPRGYHLYFKHPGNIDLPNKTSVPFEHIDFKGDRGLIIAPPSRAARGSYIWQRGLDTNPLLDLTLDYINIILNTSININKEQEVCQSQLEEDKRGQKRTFVDISFMEGHRDEALFHTANCLVKGGMDEKNIGYVLKMLAQKCCNPFFSEKEAEVKIQSALSRNETQKRNLTQEIRDWVLFDKGTFSGQQVDNDVQLRTKEDKQYRSKVLRRLVEEGLIEKVSDKRGYYRCIENQIEEIEWREASTEGIDIYWPFGIEKMVKLHPGSLVVIAGEKGAGKTAFMLNTTKLNMNRGYEIYYASSEFGGEELKERVLGFEGLTLDDWKFHFFNRALDFQDIIQPDAINIIDYLEMTDNFYLVAQRLKEIFDKLKNGIAIVAIQKDPKSSKGRGGWFSVEKARLSLNLINNFPNGQLIQIDTAKNWIDKKDNPNGKELGFSIYAGCIFTPHGEWYIPEIKRRNNK